MKTQTWSKANTRIRARAREKGKAPTAAVIMCGNAPWNFLPVAHTATPTSGSRSNVKTMGTFIVWIPLGTCERRDAVWERALTDCFYPHTEILAGQDTFVWAKHFADKTNSDKAPLRCPEKEPFYLAYDCCWPVIDGKRRPLPVPRGRRGFKENVHF